MNTRGWTGSLKNVLELDPHLFSVSLQHRHIVPKLPNVDILCIATNCFYEAERYAIYEGRFETADRETARFGVAPVCYHHTEDDVNQGDVVRWTKTNVVLYP